MIQIYKDTDAKAVFLKDSNGSQNLNTLQAVLKNPADTFLSISDLARDVELISDVEYSEFVDESETAYGNNANDVVNALNIEFTASGANNVNTPVITSSLSVNINSGDSVNYELTGNYGSEVIWDFTAAPSLTVSGENRYKISGFLTTGVYNIPVLLQNSIGEDSETLQITVSSPPYSNTRAVMLNKNDYLDATANTSNPLYRASNGTGAPDAWTVMIWFDGGTANKEQTILSYGGSDEHNEGHVWLLWDSTAGDKKLTLRYGSKHNYIQLSTPDFSVMNSDPYQNILVTYDGGTTGVSSGAVNDYYNRFKIYIDGVSQTLSGSNSNYGFSGEIKDDFFRVGEACFGGKHLRNNCLVDELAIWNSDESSNISDIYNSGNTHDLSLLTNSPTNYWRMGDGDTFPTLQDSIGSLDFIMFNMTSSDIVNDVP